MTPAAIVVVLLAAGPAEPGIEVMPVLHQGAVVVTSDDVTAGGIGGGVGAQLVVDRTWLVQADVSALWLLGQAWVVRVAAGVQRDAAWSPAAWLSLGTLWGDRVEHLGADPERPPIPTWALGVRASLLRFADATGIVSVLEAGIGTDFGGSLWLELTLLQASARW